MNCQPGLLLDYGFHAYLMSFVFINLSELCVHSTQQQEMKVEGSPYPHLAPALRTSAQHRSSSVTGPKAHATTLQTSTASGSALWTSHSTPILQQRH